MMGKRGNIKRDEGARNLDHLLGPMNKGIHKGEDQK